MKTPQPKRVLMTADPVGGVWNYALELIREFGESGLEVILATMGMPLTEIQRREARSIPNVDLRESNFRLEWMSNAWGDVVAAGEWLLDVESQSAPDLVHLNGYAHAALPWRAPKIVVGHSCVWSWWRATQGGDPPTDWNAYRESVRTGLQAADMVIAPSTAMLSMLDEHYGPFGSWKVIPNGRRNRETPKVPKEDLIFSAGRLWDEAKNIQALAEIAPSLRWPAFVAGAEGSATSEGPWRNVVHLGVLSNDLMWSWHSRAAIYCLPAKYEPFGLSILEAAIAGCALVLGDIPSLRELWADAAVFVDPAQPAELGKALDRLTTDPALRAKYAERAVARAMLYGADRMALEYLRAYAEAAKDPVSLPKPAGSNARAEPKLAA